jgi:hypothetical protein
MVSKPEQRVWSDGETFVDPDEVEWLLNGKNTKGAVRLRQVALPFKQ